MAFKNIFAFLKKKSLSLAVLSLRPLIKLSAIHMVIFFFPF